MKKDTFNILQEIQEAEMILIGLGEEFDDVKALKQMPGYTETRQKIAEDGNQWLLPALNEFYGRQRSHVEEGLKNLAKVLAGKNYFVLSVSTNETIRNIPWKEERLVMPCGGSAMKQCSEKCGHEITEITGDDRALLDSCFEKGATMYGINDWLAQYGLVNANGRVHDGDHNHLGTARQLGSHASLVLRVQDVLGVYLVDEALRHGGHQFPPDRKHEDDAIRSHHAPLIVGYQLVHGNAFAPIYEVLLVHHGVEAVGVQVDDID